MKIKKVCTIACLLWTGFVGAAFGSTTYDNFKSGLLLHFETIKSNASEIDKGVIFSQKVISQTPHLRENALLYNSGRDFLIYLAETDDDYRQLEFAEWLKASKDLLLVDQWIGNRVGWGNLVIKIAICNKIINRILEYLESPGDIEPEELGHIIKTLEDLRWQLPSYWAINYVSLRYHEGIEAFQVDSLHHTRRYVGSFYNVNAPIRKIGKYYIENYENSKAINSNIVRTWRMSENPKLRLIADYQDLYDNPIPFQIALPGSQYHQHAWDLYFYLRFIQKYGVNIVWGEITQEQVLSILQQVSDQGDEHWMSKKARNFFHNNERSYYFENLKAIESIDKDMLIFTHYYRREERKAYILKAKNKPDKKYSRFGVLTVHELP